MKVIYLDRSNWAEVVNTLKAVESELSLSLKRHRKGPSTRYYNIESGFDIETTSTTIDGHKRAWIYEWTFGIKDIIIIGRKVDDLKALFWFINRIFSRGQLVVYVHNLEYEFQFIRKYWNDMTVFSAESRKVMKATVRNIEFRDSCILSGLNLAGTAKNLIKHSIEKLSGDLDYSVVRYEDTPMTDEEYQYCINDVVIILYYINEQIAEFGDITRIPLTNTGRVRNYCREHCLFTLNRVGKKCLNKRYMDLIKSMTLDPELYCMAKSAFRGGFTHSSLRNTNRTLSRVASYDLTSAYPSVMVQFGYPMGEPYLTGPISVEDFRELKANHCLMMNVIYTNLRVKPGVNDCYLSLITSKMECDNPVLHNGRIYSCDRLNLDLVDVDTEIIDWCYDYDSMEITKAYIWERQPLPAEFIKCILKLYRDKTSLKGVRESYAEYMNSKGMLNSSYGMSVQDPLKDEALYEEGEWSSVKAPLDNLARYNESMGRFLYYIWGLWITAYCRRIIWQAIIHCGEDYCYSDTDSVKILNYEKHKQFFEDYNQSVRTNIATTLTRLGIDPREAEPLTVKGVPKLLGAFDYEGIYDEFKTLGAKRYMVRCGDDYEITVAGVAKSAVGYIVANGAFDCFNLSLTIPSAYTGKLTHTYLDDEFIDICKGHIVSAPSAIHLEPAEYSMTEDTTWIDFLNSIK